MSIENKKGNPNHFPAGTPGGKGGQFAPNLVDGNRLTKEEDTESQINRMKNFVKKLGDSFFSSNYQYDDAAKQRYKRVYVDYYFNSPLYEFFYKNATKEALEAQSIEPTMFESQDKEGIDYILEFDEGKYKYIDLKTITGTFNIPLFVNGKKDGKSFLNDGWLYGTNKTDIYFLNVLGKINRKQMDMNEKINAIHEAQINGTMEELFYNSETTPYIIGKSKLISKVSNLLGVPTEKIKTILNSIIPSRDEDSAVFTREGKLKIQESNMEKLLFEHLAGGIEFKNSYTQGTKEVFETGWQNNKLYKIVFSFDRTKPFWGIDFDIKINSNRLDVFLGIDNII